MPPADPGCSVCREIDRVPCAVLYAYMLLAWTPFWPRRMRRFLFEHDFGCEERFAAWR